MQKLFLKNLKKYDCSLITAICVCVIFGTFMVFSSSTVMADIRWSSPYKFFIKQILWVTLGFAVMSITAFLIDYKFYQKYAKLIYFISLLLVVMVLFVGSSHLGAKRWLKIYFFTIQPSELVKFSMIIFVSDFISRKKNILHQLKGLIWVILALLSIILPIALEPDLGAPILIIWVCFSMMFCAGIKMRTVFMCVMIVFFLGIVEVVRKPYRFIRFKDYFASFSNIEASSYQVKQSLNALGSGGFLGKGLGKSEMKLMYLPEAHTDFIFPIIGEELGFLGTSMVVFFFVYLFFKGIKMSKYMPDIFSYYLCLGITFSIVFESIINLSVTTGLLPAKGLPLPFISFGGTSLISTMAAAGVLINLSQYVKKNQYNKKYKK
ncbi:MAG: putative lipid II flippase FtsW [Endomicrobium sp.]|jgi:cell division protein FtsW|nr:putative lipid II flippase FtsW [Endomicrobium sp.]